MATYTGSVINDLDITTPTEGSTPPSEVNDAIREVKSCLRTTLAIEHSITNGMHLYNRAAKTADYTAVATDHIIELDCTSANVDIDLPTAVGIEGQEYILKCTNADNTPTVTPDGAETIDGTGGAVTLALNETLVVYSDNTNWQRRSITSTSGYIAIPGSSVQGNVLFHDGTVYNKLAVGTAGQVLTTQGAAADPTWATPSTLVSAEATDLVIVNTSGQENSQADVDATEAILRSTSDVPTRVTSVNLTIDMGGTLGAINSKWIAESSNTWYYIWVTNGTSGTCGGLHTSTTLATVLAAAPAGYNTYGTVVGEIRNNASSNFERIRRAGNRTQYTTITTNQRVGYATGDVGSTTVPTWVALTVRGATTQACPPTATRVLASAWCYTNLTEGIVAPNNGYGAFNSATNSPPVQGNEHLSGDIDWVLQSDDIYWAIDIGSAIYASVVVHGWVS